MFILLWSLSLSHTLLLFLFFLSLSFSLSVSLSGLITDAMSNNGLFWPVGRTSATRWPSPRLSLAASFYKVILPLHFTNFIKQWKLDNLHWTVSPNLSFLVLVFVVYVLSANSEKKVLSDDYETTSFKLYCHNSVQHASLSSLCKTTNPNPM